MQIARSSPRQSLLNISSAKLLCGIFVSAICPAVMVIVMGFILPFAPPASSAPLVSSSTAPVEKIADVRSAALSAEARQIASWVRNSLDNRELDFVIIDKKNAVMHVFNADAHFVGSSPVLLGSAVGDDSVPGIGSKPISKIGAAERTTPAGRFVAERGKNTNGEDIVWIDYDAAVSMHRVRANNKAERRLERLATPTPADNRISYGCINVPIKFYETYIEPLFLNHSAMVYVLPEVKSLADVFGSAASVEYRASPALP